MSFSRAPRQTCFILVGSSGSAKSAIQTVKLCEVTWSLESVHHMYCVLLHERSHRQIGIDAVDYDKHIWFRESVVVFRISIIFCNLENI
jgi:hypothetical protein